MYEDVIKNVEERIGQLQKNIEILRSLPEIEGANGWTDIEPWYICFNLPTDFGMIRRNQEKMEAAGYKRVGDYRTKDTGVLCQEYRKEGSTVHFFYRPQMFGSTCKVQQIGVEMVEKPIVEVVCMEAQQ